MKNLALLVLLLLTACGAQSNPNLKITDAWVREAPPGMPMAAGFLNLTNGGDEDLVLVAAESDAYGRVEIHETRLDNGVARMRELESLTIAAGTTVVFEPGGRHLMLMQPQRALKSGDRVRVTLSLKGGDQYPVEFEVKKR